MGIFLKTFRNLLFIIAIVLFFGAAVILLVKAFEYKAIVLGSCAIVVAAFGLPTVKRLVDLMSQ